MKKILINSGSKAWKKRLTDKNHLINFKDRIKDIYDSALYTQSDGTDAVHKSISTNITPDIESPFFSSKGKHLDVIVYVDRSFLAWELVVDMLVRTGTFARRQIVDYDFGYILGTHSPLASFSNGMMLSASMYKGYQMWEKITYLTPNHG